MKCPKSKWLDTGRFTANGRPRRNSIAKAVNAIRGAGIVRRNRVLEPPLHVFGRYGLVNRWRRLFLRQVLFVKIQALELLALEKPGFDQDNKLCRDFVRAKIDDRRNVKMNVITVHGKVVKPAEMKLINLKGEPNAMAVFTVVDLGLPNQQTEPIFFTVNYPKDAAALIADYLVEGKEVNIVGTMRQRFHKGPDGKKVPYNFLQADIVELLPVFAAKRKTNAEAAS